MPPRKQVPTTTERQSEERQAENPPDTTTTPVTDAMENTAHITNLLQNLMAAQQASQESFEREFQRQEHRWRTFQHQFGQLQQEVQQERRERQLLGGATETAPATVTGAHILHRIRVAEHAQPRVSEAESTPTTAQSLQPTYTGWKGPKMAPLQEEDDIDSDSIRR